MSARGLVSKIANQGDEEYNEEGEDMDIEDEKKGEDVEITKELAANPKKK